MKAVTLKSLPPLARTMARETLNWLEPYHDASCDLLLYPGTVGSYGSLQAGTARPHLVRESAWWAMGLLLRNQGDDAARAERILNAVLRWQFNEPGQPYHGSFHRAPEEAVPSPKKCEMWADYDPNWLQFIGTSFIVILEKLSDRVSPALQARLKKAIRLAVEGEPPDRIAPRYSNIAVMQAAQLVYAGTHFRKPAWKKRGLLFARQVYNLFLEHETFPEFNSPTYYGVNLYGLRLWQFEMGTPELKKWGATMEAALWRHLARYYHPRLRNICGPFDRAYGMDMPNYCSGIGLWMRLELEPGWAPVPLLNTDFGHRHDYAMALPVAILGTKVPADVRTQLRKIPKKRKFRQIIETKPETRIATVCMTPDRMWGAEGGTSACGWGQCHFATAHWLQPDGSVGWLRLENEMPVDAIADDEGIKLTATNGPAPRRLIWHLSVNQRPLISGKKWKLPGMMVRVKTDLPAPALAEGKPGSYTVTYEMAPSQKATLELGCSADKR